MRTFSNGRLGLVAMCLSMCLSAFAQSEREVYWHRDSVVKEALKANMMSVRPIVDTSRVQGSPVFRFDDSLARISDSLRILIAQPPRRFVHHFDLYENTRLDTIRYIAIYHSDITKIPSIVYQCSDLRELRIYDAKVKSLPRGLGKLSRLDSVLLERCGLKKGNFKVKGNIGCSYIVLKDNEFGSFPIRLRKLRSLRTIDLSNNKMETFDFSQLKGFYLNELDLSKNNISLINKRVPGRVRIQKIKLVGNKLSDLATDLHKIKDLQSLNFADNQIESVKICFSDLVKLEYLIFYKNRLRSAPLGVYASPSLVHLDFYYNEITEINDSIANLKTLQELYFSFNKVERLPETIGKLTDLQKLYLHHNSIAELPPSVCHLTNLQYLHLNNNKLTELPDCLGRLEKLRDIDISVNGLTEIPTEILDLPNIEVLFMQGNLLEEKLSTDPEFEKRLEKLSKRIERLQY